VAFGVDGPRRSRADERGIQISESGGLGSPHGKGAWVMSVTSSRPRRTLRIVPFAVIGVAWVLAAVAEGTGQANGLHHDGLIGGNLPFLLTLGLFLLAWQVMIAAMMLPSSLPFVRLFVGAIVDRARSGRTLGALLAGYAIVWTTFGAVAFGGDLALHQVAHSSPRLHEQQWLIAGAVLAVAGGFQFSSLKDRCLRVCRHPGVYLMRHYRHGTRAAFRLGVGHAFFCLGCCWALMLLMFAAGVANLWWMAALTALMVYEKTGRHGVRVARIAGVLLLVWAGFVLTQPAWLPEVLSGAP
jgi:predicted metal-binding membrane protein